MASVAASVKTPLTHVIRRVIGVFFEYDTPKIVHIRSKKAGVINRLLQLIIIGYIIGYVIVWKKGYQEFDSVKSTVTSKMKGVVRTVINGKEVVMDVADYSIPPQENGAFFVTTNIIRTENQKQSICTEDPDIPHVHCTSDEDCPADKPVHLGNGVRTGKCNTTAEVCEIYAWCPVENGERPKIPTLAGSENFTVFIKNNIQFPKFNVKKRNLPEKANDSYLQNCHYDAEEHPYCPIFYLGNIANATNSSYQSMAGEGAVVEIAIKWSCNLDYDLDNCIPEYQFSRIDSSQYKISKGYNFRYALYYKINDTDLRTLTKAYGIKFIINVMGRGSKFSVVPLLLNIASGIALLSIATVICDIVVLYVLKSHELYYKKKYLTVKGADAYSVLDENSRELASSEESVVRSRRGKQDSINYQSTENVK